jgi:hypothetical protein
LLRYLSSPRALTTVTTGATRSPHLTLAVTAAVVLVLEGLRGSNTLYISAAWPVLQALVAAVGLAAV